VSSTDGKPIPGATVWTWPFTKEVFSQSDGRFEFEGIQVYDTTLVLASAEGWGAGVAAVGKQLPNLRVNCPAMNRTDWKWGFVLRTMPEGPIPRDLAWAWDAESLQETNGKTMLSADVVAFQQLCTGFGGEGYVFGNVDAPGLVEAASDPRGPSRWVFFPSKSGGKFTDYVNTFRSISLQMKKLRIEFFSMGPLFSGANTEDSCRFLGYNGDLSDMAISRVEQEKFTRVKSALSCLNRAIPLGKLYRIATTGKNPDGYGIALAYCSLVASWAAEPDGPLFFDRDGRLPVPGSPLARAVELLGDFGPGERLDVLDCPADFHVAARRTSQGAVFVFAVNGSPDKSVAVNLSLGSRHGNLLVDARLEKSAVFTLPAGAAAVLCVTPGPGQGVRGRWWGYHQAVKGEGVQDLEIR
jgi:hypothetical protein